MSTSVIVGEGTIVSGTGGVLIDLSQSGISGGSFDTVTSGVTTSETADVDMSGSAGVTEAGVELGLNSTAFLSQGGSASDGAGILSGSHCDTTVSDT